MAHRLVTEEFDQLCTLLLISHEEGDLDEEELLLLLASTMDDAANSLLPPLQFIGRRLCIEELDDETCLRRFRLRRGHIYELREALHLPPRFSSPCRVTWTSLEGLLVLLRRLAYPARLGDLCEEFGRSKPVLSVIFNTMLIWTWERWGALLTDPFARYLDQERIASYSRAVAGKSNVDLNIWGFIDGTVRRICRPDEDQREYYNGHKRLHGLKYQVVTTPDGLICSLSGPYEGRRHDAGVFARSGLLEQLQQHMNLPGGETYALFGDSAFPFSVYLQKGYAGNHLTPAQEAFNARMSSVRQAVEWSFEEITTYWPYLDMKRQQKVGLQPVGLHFRVAVLLINCLTCMKRGNEVSDYFQLSPPILQDYLHDP